MCLLIAPEPGTIGGMGEVTSILVAIGNGDMRAADRLLPLVYDELRVLAAQKLAREFPGQTLQPTALVHEVYLRFVGEELGGSRQTWKSKGHFLGTAAEAMRRILVERARHKHSLKAGDGCRRHDIADVDACADAPDAELLALNEALEKLEQQDKRKAELVKLRYFAGLTIEEAAKALDISTSTAERDWFYARSWLRVEMEGTEGNP
jgi:RNA polymerase sigma factor (TIGR02999 family)